MLTVVTDLGLALLRVHLPGHHVISILLFRPGPCPRSDLDGGASGIRPVYLNHRLVLVNESLLVIMLLPWRREFCLRHPETRDVTDIGQMLFWNSKWAWYATAIMFLLNNTFIQVRETPSSPQNHYLLTDVGLARLDWRQISEHHDES